MLDEEMWLNLLHAARERVLAKAEYDTDSRVTARRCGMADDALRAAVNAIGEPAAASSSATAAPKCVKCRHNQVGLSGYCIHQFPDHHGNPAGGYLCGCKCEFTETVATPTAAPSSAFVQAFRDTAVKLHAGYKHKGPWEECEWVECEDRRKMINEFAEPGPTTTTANDLVVDLQRELAFLFGAYHAKTDHHLPAVECTESECVKVRKLLYSVPAVVGITGATVRAAEAIIDEFASVILVPDRYDAKEFYGRRWADIIAKHFPTAAVEAGGDELFNEALKWAANFFRSIDSAGCSRKECELAREVANVLVPTEAVSEREEYKRRQRVRKLLRDAAALRNPEGEGK